MYLTTVAQNHIPVQHTIPHGTTRICWGYAMGVAGGSTCDPTTIIPNTAGIDGSYFTEYSWSEIDSRPLQEKDILYWPGTHAAYVTSVPYSGGYVDVNNIGVSHMSASQWSGVISETLADAKTRVGVGNPSSFWRRKQVSITVSNSFGGGTVNVAGNNVSSGSSSSVNWWTTVSLEAINQNYSNVWRQWDDWQESGEDPVSQNPFSIIAKSGGSYTANFTHWSDISFSNSFPGGSGGTISVWDTSRAAPGTVRMPQNASFNISASSSTTINRIEYTFSQWSGASTSSNASLSSQSASENKTYTANYTSKPQQPANIWAGGDVDENIQVAWTEHPNTNVTQYQIWRRVKDNGVLGSPTLEATVNRGTTSYTDTDFIITASYTEDLIYYDVRSVFVVAGQSTQYSDENYTDAVFGSNNFKTAGSANGSSLQAESSMPAEYSISSYPNPFNPSTTLSYSLVENADVTLAVYDMTGREIAVLVRAQQSAGTHTAQWSGKDASSGTYMYRLTATPNSGKLPIILSGKLLLTK